MVWKALEALGMLSEALGSFDVNTVCPLLGSWINHVVCIFPCFFEDEVNFGCIFTGLAESRPWECRVFSFKTPRTSYKSLVFHFTFANSLRTSYVLYVFNMFVSFFVPAVHDGAGSS